MIRSAVRLPIPGTAWKRLASPAAIARSSSRTGPPESAAMATFGPDAADRDQLQEEIALLLAGEAVEAERVVAGDQVGVQGGVLAARRHRLQGLGGDGEAVADAARVDHDVVGATHQHLSADGGDHAVVILGRGPDAFRRGRAAGRPSRRALPRLRPRWRACRRWGGRSARRGRASRRRPRGRSRPRRRRRRGPASGGSGSPSRLATMRCTWPLSAEPEPQTAFLTACGV